MKALANTLLRDPQSGDIVAVAAGDEVPSWAEGLLGAHLVAAESPQGGPDESWTVDDLRDYAKAHDVSLKGAASKADILAAIEG